MPALELSALLDPATIRRPPRRLLLAEAASLLARRPGTPDPASLPNGAGRTVLVLPAFLAGDGFTRDLRAFLQACGFRALGWGLGTNWGPTPRILDGLNRRLDVLARSGPVGLAGISLGGVLARNLAYERAPDISHVVTIASPFRLPAATSIGPLIRVCARRYTRDMDPKRLSLPLPVPSTMILTRDDGIVAPEDCWMTQAGGRVVRLRGPHITLARNPDALRAAVEGLASGQAVPAMPPDRPESSATTSA